MRMARATRVRQRWPELARWSACFAIALFFHVAGATAMLVRWHEESDLLASAPVVLVELAPMAVSPQIKPNELPPGPEQVESERVPDPKKPVDKLELTPDATAEMPMPPKQVEKPKDKKPQRNRVADLTSAPSAAEQQATRAAAPMPGAVSRYSNALPNWKSLLVAQLERNKRYPSEAQSRGDHGVAQLAFSVDRAGRVHNARIVRSSGSSLLDAATLQMVERAQPLPQPPAEIGGPQIAIVVPIRYNIR